MYHISCLFVVALLMQKLVKILCVHGNHFMSRSPSIFHTITLCLYGQDFLLKFDKNKFVVVVFSMFIRKLSLFQVINV